MSNKQYEEAFISRIQYAFETRNSKVALVECDKALTKYPDSKIFKALKSVALAKTHSPDEALEFADEVLNSEAGPNDFSIIQTLSITYRDLGLNDRLEKLYSFAVQKYPKEESFSVELFLSCVRNLDFKKQHKAAIDLNKKFPKRSHLWWTILSFYLEYKYSDNERGGMMALTLAQRMCLKALKEDLVQSRAEISIMCIIMNEKEVNTEVLNFVNKSSSTLSVINGDPDLRVTHLKMLNSSGDYLKHFDTSLELFEKSNNWAEYLEIISALGTMVTKDPATKDSKQQILRNLLNKWTSDPVKKRSSLLGKLELTFLLNKKDSDIQIKQLWDYFDAFSKKPLCFSDVAWYTQAFSSKGKVFNNWTKILEKRISNIDKSKLVDEGNVIELVNLEKLKWLSDDIAVFHGHRPKNINHIQQAVSLLGLIPDLEKKLIARETLNDMILLACFHLIKQAHMAMEEGKINEGYALYHYVLIILESELNASSTYYQYKLLIVRAYLKLGSFSKAREWYSSLSIKNIQHDSMSYWILGHGKALGCHQNELDECLESLRVYKSNRDDTPEMISIAYKRGAYDKALEFVDFYERLSNSLQGACTLAIAMQSTILLHEDPEDILNMLTESSLPNSIPVDSAYIAKLSDNRDFSVLHCPSLNYVVAASTKDESEQLEGFIGCKNTKTASIEQSLRSLPIMNKTSLEIVSRFSYALYYIATKNVEMLRENTRILRSLCATEPKYKNLIDSSFEPESIALALAFEGDTGYTNAVSKLSIFDTLETKFICLISDISAFYFGLFDPETSSENHSDKVIFEKEQSLKSKLCSNFTCFTETLCKKLGQNESDFISNIPQFIRYTNSWTEIYSFIWLTYKALSLMKKNSSANEIDEKYIELLSSLLEALLTLMKECSKSVIDSMKTKKLKILELNSNVYEQSWGQSCLDVLKPISDIVTGTRYKQKYSLVQNQLKSSWVVSLEGILIEIERRKL
ncbi:hypothetical protein BB559_001077 [Furculomyces boomerangus]|uniref:Uncharacterized protein n=1 Tax=Furculomyces boomerangus TaxID=61424 RepID=A0A2T9Z367_9FUNG|nr:hypothetical protein BB559_001077 [Furculomyces boomerangus]